MQRTLSSSTGEVLVPSKQGRGFTERDSETNSDLEDLPDWIAQVLIAERKHR